jgi:hypothetical protein
MDFEIVAQSPAPETPAGQRPGQINPELWSRIMRYIEKVDVAVSGQGGSIPTFRLANVLVHGFALCREQALGFMHAYSVKCVPLWSAKEIEHKVDDALKASHDKPRGYLLNEDESVLVELAEFPSNSSVGIPQAGESVPSENAESSTFSTNTYIDLEQAPKPTFPEAALYGLLGDITRFIMPQTEADSAAIYTQLLAAYGNNIGRKAFFQVEQTNHYTNLFANLVGRSSKGRKGTALDYIKKLYGQADPTYLSQFARGLSSGEGLMWAVRDPISKTQYNKKNQTSETVQVDPGVTDKRLLVTETEFARALRVMARPTNILSTVIRDAWDSGDLRTLTKNEPARATNAHISIIGHITEEELEKELAECDLFNGFAGRFLWIAVSRSQLLPEGGNLEEETLKEFASKLRQSLFDAVTRETHQVSRETYQMTRDKEAREHWKGIYAELSAERPGMLGAATNRAEALVLRVSMILALTDGSYEIRLPHQQAALAFWDYCLGSARRFFGHRVSDPKAQKIFDELRKRPEGMTRRQISEEIFARNLTAERITFALQMLLKLKLAHRKTESTNWRDAERWYAATG